jgi:hypothetical protein
MEKFVFVYFFSLHMPHISKTGSADDKTYSVPPSENGSLKPLLLSEVVKYDGSEMSNRCQKQMVPHMVENLAISVLADVKPMLNRC